MPGRAPIIRHAALPSTMDEARRLANDGAVNFTAVQAGEQTAGRGRFGNQWVSRPGNLYMTVIIRRDGMTPDMAGQLSFISAVALGQGLVRCGAPDAAVRLKWPNDVLLNGKKTAGILLETQISTAGSCDFVLIGTGVNIAHAPDDRARLQDVAPAAGVDDVQAAYLDALAALYQQWLEDGFAPVRAAWLARAYGIGLQVTARFRDRSVQGLFRGVNEDGALVLAVDGGDEILVSSAEIQF